MNEYLNSKMMLMGFASLPKCCRDIIFVEFCGSFVMFSWCKSVLGPRLHVDDCSSRWLSCP